jgi:inner membrane transporter RhtA
MTLLTKEAEGAALPLLPVGALFGAMFSIQYGATLAKDLFPVFDAIGTTSLRLIVAALILGLLLKPWRARPSGRILPALLVYGVVLALMNLSFYLSLKTIPLGIASALQFIGPLLVATLTSRRPVDFVWIALAGLGIVLMVPPIDTAQPLDPMGVLYALGAGAGWALYIVCGQKAGHELGSKTTAIGMAVAALVLLPVGAEHVGTALSDPWVLLLVVAVGILSGVIPFSLEMYGLTRLPARAYGTLVSAEPVIGALLGLILLHEALTLAQWAGVIVIAAAVLGTAMTARRA